MSRTSCPVSTAIIQLQEIIQSGRLLCTETQSIAKTILEHLNYIAEGSANNEHLNIINSLSQKLTDNTKDTFSKETGKMIRTALSGHQEVFKSHIQTRICPTGDCIKLTPAPCQMACPAGVDVPTYITLIGMGKDAEAIEVIRKDLPFPWICGLVCTRPCEFMCIRKNIDTPVSIKTIKAFAAQKAMSDHTYKNPDKTPANHKKVCVIGAGPAGMTAAYYLALKGYCVRVIESLPKAGGMLVAGIPEFRLPRQVIQKEVAMIQALGVEFCFNTRFGKDVTFEQLKTEGFEAFFFAIGAHRSLKLRIPGERDFPQVIDGTEMLKQTALGNYSANQISGKKVIVIGGGNTAIDAARTCLRLGCKEVMIAYRRTRLEMPADAEEIKQAEEEGVKFSFLTIPIEITGENSITALKCLRAKLVEREGHSRKFPVPEDGSDHFIETDAVITAIGQQVDTEGMKALTGIKWTKQNTIDVNTVTMETTENGIFAAGDAVTGPATVIEAIAGGKKAAQSIDRYLRGIPQPETPPVQLRRGRLECLEVSADTKMMLKRLDMPLLSLDKRQTTFEQAESGYSEHDVRQEALRCLRCDICVRCGECVEICRDKLKINALHMGYVNSEHLTVANDKSQIHTDFRLTRESCIACGACAVNCPNNAMQIKDVNGERMILLCGTVLTRQKLVYCDICGAVMGTAAYLDYIQKQTCNGIQIIREQTICEICARKETARGLLVLSL